MVNGVRRSLTKEEHAIRVRFDSARSDAKQRAELWQELQRARARGARRRDRLVATVRFKESPKRTASCLVSDLKIVAPDVKVMAAHANRVDAYVPCELLFDTDVLPCDRPGPCPHELVVYVMAADNVATDSTRRAVEALQQMAEQAPRAR